MKGQQTPRCIYCGRKTSGRQAFPPYTCAEHRALLRNDPKFAEARRSEGQEAFSGRLA